MGNKFSKLIALIVAFFGVLVMIGWILDIPTLKSILPQFVTMKFSTAVCFVLGSITLYCTAKIDNDDRGWVGIILIFINFITILIMASYVISIFTGVKTGMEDLFVREPVGAVNTTVPGRPALFTMINFIFVAIIGLLNLFKTFGVVLKVMNILEGVIIFLSSLAIVGYIISMPQFYGSFNNISTAMALHTAILFILLGIGFVIQNKSTKSVEQ